MQGSRIAWGLTTDICRQYGLSPIQSVAKKLIATPLFSFCQTDPG